jgi:Skp family chaperone for outer membrane proteins
VFSTNFDQFKREVEKDLQSIVSEYEKQVEISKKKIKEIEKLKKEKNEEMQMQATDQNQKALRKALGKETRSEIIDLVDKNINKVNKVEVGDD